MCKSDYIHKCDLCKIGGPTATENEITGVGARFYLISGVNVEWSA